MSVAVLSKNGILLMPTSEYRARKLLESKKAIIHGYYPFTIQLTERETGYVQPVELCMDTGYIHIGTSVKSEKHEYLGEQIDTLTDERQKHNACRMYRRQIRNRKRYRQPRSITGSVMTDGLPHLWNIRRTSIFRRFHASAK